MGCGVVLCRGDHERPPLYINQGTSGKLLCVHGELTSSVPIRVIPRMSSTEFCLHDTPPMSERALVASISERVAFVDLLNSDGGTSFVVCT